MTRLPMALFVLLFALLLSGPLSITAQPASDSTNGLLLANARLINPDSKTSNIPGASTA